MPLNWIFIHGHLGLPALGGAGCGFASGTVMWAMLLAMLAIIRTERYRACAIFARFERPHGPTLRALLAIGVPIGIAVFAESSIFSVVALLIGELGPTVVAGHQVALNFSGSGVHGAPGPGHGGDSAGRPGAGPASPSGIAEQADQAFRLVLRCFEQ